MEETIGQVAYEACRATFLRGGRDDLSWSELANSTHAAWEAAANAVYQRAVEEFLTEEERQRMMAREPSAPSPPPVCTVCHATARRARLSEDRWAARIKVLEERIGRAEAVLRGEL